MAVHDRYLRRTPTELLFPDAKEAEERLTEIERAAEAAGVDLADPLEMGALPAVAELLAHVRPPGDDPHATHAYAFLLFFALRLWRAGSEPWLIRQDAVRHLVDPDLDVSEWTGVLPTGAGYLQLPSNLFFVRPEAEGPAEPVDGIYWFVSEADDLWVLLASGVRDGRAGFSAVALDRLPAAHARAWADEVIREDGPDFQSTLPGGHLDRLYSIETAGEALKLLARVHAHLEAHPQALTEPESPSPGAERPTASRFAYRRIELVPGITGDATEEGATTH